jgi:hypothetical protein
MDDVISIRMEIDKARPVSLTALRKRINRRLPDQVRLRRSRGRYWKSQFGDWCLFDYRRNCAEHTHVNLKQLGQQLGALAPGDFFTGY